MSVLHFSTDSQGDVPAHSPSQQQPRSELWADKYKPRSIAEMCYPVCANKLKAWLENFTAVGSPGDDPKKPHGVLLSGSPGVGKTTTVYVVARELGRTVVEYNASDFRSRKSLRENVSDLTGNRAFSAQATSYTNVVLLMDEVDGCDIGGVGEVIEMLKTTRIPIICTCNDRWHPKLRSLLNYVEDMRFSHPPCNIVANYLCDRVLAREGISLSKPLLQDIIKKSGSDIRNMLNNLQLWCLNRTSLEQRQLAECAAQATKDGDAGLFDSAEYFLLQGTSRGERHSIAEMQSCYYNSDLIDLFVQENYLHFNPAPVDGRDWMGAVAQAASAISRADAAQRIMYYEQNWSVSRFHVLSSSIAPCVYTRGKYETFLTGQQKFFDLQRPVKFPQLLGHNSTAGKNRRLAQCVAMQASHPTHGISGNQEDVVADYMPHGWERPLAAPLAENEKEGIAAVIAFMDQYNLMRDDWDVVQTLTHFKRMETPSAVPPVNIATAVKAAFTREFNRTHRFDSFAKSTLKRTDKGDAANAGGEENGDAEEGSQNDAGSGKAKRGKVIADGVTAVTMTGVGAAKPKAAARKPRAKKSAAAAAANGSNGGDADAKPARKKAAATSARKPAKAAAAKKKKRGRVSSSSESETEISSGSSSSSSESSDSD
ncbi:putative replication factor C subunit 1 [Leptomonas pyrrhocoris]|uniref:Putative replication factor C subunit 1 n=1 Tax=Leptomonas pyrrhocoris TaxID=157538 RepID=A0A0M9FZF8_LEPPY|nr:putative replication factor C subunit 1 [Leptomonas pyrrhocoris]XP_015657573.1 putative replication factor C subunit 1 [Leptomonas pyrrhocoris]XP_015657574.1 putative replication factor C subunit 1 [Leptomonas pyrrhocoris]KPA79133.1 putative replication factor C subunit 1 [Leptomonas pyrrhocoris]KPA79134.1 putative replication factor C subunit 1 [Leptomonas pyrrhocoris]KPA79135.1 putative replication factor C subunit 1 [Leptomonas pyrrhocoris]|eukprot:XP_015657572.1 putative replication factor C subunit 1 [Leptomonas pyrrhocoris]